MKLKRSARKCRIFLPQTDNKRKPPSGNLWIRNLLYIQEWNVSGFAHCRVILWRFNPTVPVYLGLTPSSFKFPSFKTKARHFRLRSFFFFCGCRSSAAVFIRFAASAPPRGRPVITSQVSDFLNHNLDFYPITHLTHLITLNFLMFFFVLCKTGEIWFCTMKTFTCGSFRVCFSWLFFDLWYFYFY